MRVCCFSRIMCWSQYTIVPASGTQVWGCSVGSSKKKTPSCQDVKTNSSRSLLLIAELMQLDSSLDFYDNLIVIQQIKGKIPGR